jgi:hypothetical protein
MRKIQEGQRSTNGHTPSSLKALDSTWWHLSSGSVHVSFDKQA